LSQLGVPHIQNFEILEFLSNLKSFENFKKVLNGSKFDKRCLLRISIQNFFQILAVFLKKGQKFVVGQKVRLGRS
jgi:hypothetical protein